MSRLHPLERRPPNFYWLPIEVSWRLRSAFRVRPRLGSVWRVIRPATVRPRRRSLSPLAAHSTSPSTTTAPWHGTARTERGWARGRPYKGSGRRMRRAAAGAATAGVCQARAWAVKASATPAVRFRRIAMPAGRRLRLLTILYDCRLPRHYEFNRMRGSCHAMNNRQCVWVIIVSGHVVFNQCHLLRRCGYFKTT